MIRHTCNKNHMAIEWSGSSVCPLCACYAEFEKIERIAELETFEHAGGTSTAANAFREIHKIALLGASE